MSISYSFSGKRVLITGGAQGIGRILVQRFHDAGAAVFTIDKNQDAVSKLVEELPCVKAVVVDLSKWEETRAAIKTLGEIDFLINDAGIFIPEPFMEVSEQSATLNFAVHVGAVYNISQVVAQGFTDRGVGGAIINVSSTAARLHHNSASNYGPMKAAVENLTKSMAVELMPNNIRVNCILPGLVNTGIANQGNVNPELAKRWESLKSKMFGNRAINPEEIADLVVFLLSPVSTMITGQSIVIDGGLTAS